MAAGIIQSDDEGMVNISQRFDDQADQVRTVYEKIENQLEVLEKGGWEGPNADKAFEIFRQVLLPAVQRLSKGLDQASTTTRQVAKMIRDADEETKSLFPA
jgi:WXG100 family type VII secretion target